MTEGLRITDEYGRTIKITPLVSSIITSGIYASPTALNEDGTYGFDIDLPGTTAIPLENLLVFTQPKNWTFAGSITSIAFGSSPSIFYSIQTFANSLCTYYQMDLEGIMSVWTAGACVPDEANTWDLLLTTVPTVRWLANWTLGYSRSVRIFPAVGYLVFDKSENTLISVFSLHGLPDTTYGVHISDVSILLKDWDY